MLFLNSSLFSVATMIPVVERLTKLTQFKGKVTVDTSASNPGKLISNQINLDWLLNQPRSGKGTRN